MPLALGLLLLQFTVPLIAVDARPPYAADVNLFIWELPLIAAGAVAAPAVRARIRERRVGAGAAIWALVVGLLGVALVVHPSLAGAETVLRCIAALGLAIAIAELRGEVERRLILGALVAATLMQLALGVLQLARGAPLGLAPLGEFSDPLVARHGTFAPRGTMAHPYVLTGMALITAALVVSRTVRASRPLPWIATLALTVVPVGLTFSRAAAAGLAAGIAVLAPAALARRGVHAVVIAAIFLGAGVPAILLLDGWTARVDQTLFTEGPVTAADRRSVILLGIETVMAEPLTGVGPRRYLSALAERTGQRDATSDLRPHSVPLLVAAEAGAAAGVAMVILLGVVGWRALRAGPTPAFLFLVFVPYLAVDQFPYTDPQGLALLGVWLGYLDAAHREAAASRAAAPVMQTAAPLATAR